MEILEASVGQTMCAPLQRHLVIDTVRYLAQNRLDGAFVECGVWRGGMMQIAARTALVCANEAGAHRLPTIWLYDTFEGMPEPDDDADRDMYNGVHASTHLARSERTGPDGEPTVWCVASLADVKRGMLNASYPESKVRYVKGMVEETIPADAPERISFLRIDTDWHSSTKHILDHLYDRVIPGGVIAFDDYESWLGARKAVDEFFGARALSPLLIRLDKGRVLVKT